ncbi:MAG TPA: adenylyl-sulfate kinase [Candidatus Caenarcaniphilales bacterium]
MYINGALEVCEQQGVKQLYQQAWNGQIHYFAGVNDPYEPPGNLEVDCQASLTTVA